MDAMTFARLRAEFPIAERYTYLNHAAIAPLPRRAVDRVAALALAVGATGDRGFPERNRAYEEVRALAARLLGARRAHEVAFVENSSSGLSLVAQAIDWRRGDNIVGTACEFPSNVYPWMQLGERGVEYRAVPERGGRVDTGELLASIDGRTRAVALSWVEYANGFRFDLGRVGAACRERGVLFVVDVIQGLGALALDVERDGVDVACGAAHKWLLGPEGIALLYVSDRVVERLPPVRSGWRSMRDMEAWTEPAIDWAEGAKRYESGTLNGFGIYALGASLEILLAAGPAAIEDRVLALAERAARGLAALGFELVSSRRPGETSGIVCATHPRLPAPRLVERLAARGVITAARAGRLRVSPHAYNTEGEIDRFLNELRTEV
ncbi:MAG TPA: aminotransferase class V-fold PLP-dependent enzyme [Thermoanaerobaculia bacterium]|jgi:selenocysteine lyase/cysteine desulfurase